MLEELYRKDCFGPRLGHLGGKKPLKAEERTSMTNNELGDHDVLKLQTMWPPKQNMLKSMTHKFGGGRGGGGILNAARYQCKKNTEGKKSRNTIADKIESFSERNRKIMRWLSSFSSFYLQNSISDKGVFLWAYARKDARNTFSFCLHSILHSVLILLLQV